MYSSRTNAILLAAGLSRRFDSGNKLLHPLGAKPLWLHALDNLIDSLVNNIIVVTQPNADGLINSLHSHSRFPEIEHRVKLVANNNYKDGMAGSIKAGIDNCNSNGSNCDHVLICLADMPNVKSQTVNALISSAESTINKSIFIPTNSHGRGNPVLFRQSMFPKLALLRGDAGAKSLIRQNSAVVEAVPTDDTGIHQDFDLRTDFDNE